MPSGLPLTQAVDQTIFLEIPETDLDSIHTIQWERDIIWDDPDESHDAVAELRSNRQGGNTPGHEGSWDDLDQALEMDLDPLSAKTYVWQRPVPVLEPLPNHKGAGEFVCMVFAQALVAYCLSIPCCMIFANPCCMLSVTPLLHVFCTPPYCMLSCMVRM